jgi:hypothetical protein
MDRILVVCKFFTIFTRHCKGNTSLVVGSRKIDDAQKRDREKCKDAFNGRLRQGWQPCRLRVKLCKSPLPYPLNR